MTEENNKDGKNKDEKNKQSAEVASEKNSHKIRRFVRRKDDPQGSSTSMWLISFTDVMALMLTFFVLLFAMSNPDQEKFEQFKENIQKNFNKFDGENLNRGSEDSINIARVNFNKALDIQYLEVLIKNLVSQNPELGQITVMQNAGLLILSMPQEMLFESGGATIKAEATRTLNALVNSLRRIRNSIEVVGHTDPRPVTSGAFASNWELSLTRAANVAALLKNLGYDEEIRIKGYSSGRFNDLSEEFSQDVRMDLSRRVDIIIREDDGNRAKLFDIGLP